MSNTHYVNTLALLKNLKTKVIAVIFKKYYKNGPVQDLQNLPQA